MNTHWRKGKLSEKLAGWTTEMLQQVRALDTKPDNLSSMPGTHVVDGRRQTARVVSDFSTCTLAFRPVCASFICQNLCDSLVGHTKQERDPTEAE